MKGLVSSGDTVLRESSDMTMTMSMSMSMMAKNPTYMPRKTGRGKIKLKATIQGIIVIDGPCNV
jgi:hypothetical protein